MISNISIIGAGKVATALATAFYDNGLHIHQVFSPSYSRVQLAEKVKAEAVDSIAALNRVDLIIVAVSDDALPELVAQIDPEQLWAHTSGSVGLDKLSGSKKAVFYPLQTFSEGKKVNWKELYFCLETDDPGALELLKGLADLLGSKWTIMSSKDRSNLHLAAVIACNFSNAMYSMSKEIMDKSGLDFNLLQPLIKETAEKITYLSPVEAQTGPAVRNDMEVIQKQMKQLDSDPELREIYTMITRYIQRSHEKL
jgi:predicted short-subunit dehydrogenase-like oxidoreductase (DUF2520 family)